MLILGVVMGLGLLMQGVNANISGNIDQIQQSLGNIVMVLPPGSGNMPALGNGALDETIIDELQGIPHVDEVVGRINGRPDSTDLEGPSFGGGGFLGGRGAPPGIGGDTDGPLIILNGIAAGQPLTTPQGGEAEVISGRNLTQEDASQNVAVVGERLATRNGLQPGSTFELNEEEFTVIGIYSTGTMFDSLGMYIPVDTAKRILEIEGQVSAIQVEVDYFDNVETVIDTVQDRLGDRADVISPLTMVTRFIGSTLTGVASTMETGANATLILGAIVLLFTMMLVIRESSREIGTLKAIGASNLQVLLQFTTQSLALALIGIAMSIGFYLFGTQALPVILPAGPIGFLFGNVEVSLEVALSYSLWAVLAGIAGGLIPSLYAARINPAEVLRHGN
jgi:ABC-type antimicrobial peptide transport system permease subunit